jgi:hypothetical protein
MKRQIDDRTYLNYLMQSLNVDALKQVCRDFELKGYSRLKKVELIDFILDSLADEELKELIKKKEMEIISDGIDLAIKKIKGEDRENLVEVKIVNPDEHEIELFFKGWNWEVSSYLSITPKNINDPERDCDCRIGSNMGFCSHFWIGFIVSLKEGFFKVEDWNLTILPKNFEKDIQSIEISAISGEEVEAEGEPITLIDTSSEDAELMKFLDQSLTIYEGEITKIDKKQQQFQENITTYYLAKLENVKLGPRVQSKSDFDEDNIETLNDLNIRISERLYEEKNLQVGDKITTNGKLTRDDFLRLYIVKNIRKITKINT